MANQVLNNIADHNKYHNCSSFNMKKNPSFKGRVVCDHTSRSKSTLKQKSLVLAPKARSKVIKNQYSDCASHAGIGYKLINDNLHFMTTCNSYEQASNSGQQLNRFHGPFLA